MTDDAKIAIKFFSISISTGLGLSIFIMFLYKDDLSIFNGAIIAASSFFFSFMGNVIALAQNAPPYGPSRED